MLHYYHYRYLIFEKRANVNVSDDAGMTPLHLAAFCCFKDVVLWLLKVGADVNTKNKWGDKPVDMVDGKYYDIISLINEYQAPVALVRGYFECIIVKICNNCIIF